MCISFKNLLVCTLVATFILRIRVIDCLKELFLPAFVHETKWNSVTSLLVDHARTESNTDLKTQWLDCLSWLNLILNLKPIGEWDVGNLTRVTVTRLKVQKYK